MVRSCMGTTGWSTWRGITGWSAWRGTTGWLQGCQESEYVEEQCIFRGDIVDKLPILIRAVYF